MSVRLLLVFLVSALMSCWVGTVRAAMVRTPVEQRARAFLLAKDIHQWLDFDYQYDYYSTDSGANDTLTSHDLYLRNTYHFDTLYAILRPKLLMGSLAMDIGFDGEWQKDNGVGDDIGTNPTVEYRLDGTFFKDENYPIDFNSFYEKDMVDRAFASNYTMDSRGESLSFTYKNPWLPSSLTYSQSGGETSGLTNDRTSSSQNVLLNSTHQYKNFSTTGFNMMTGLFETKSSDVDSQEMTTETVSLSGNNNLNFAKNNLIRYFDSLYSYSDSTSEYSDLQNRKDDWNKNAVWTERLYWQMGRALFTGLDYRNSFFESPTNEQETQVANGWFRHQLFDNFSTNFRAGGRESLFLDGVESGWAGNLNFHYTRHLPKESNLAFGLDNGYGVTDRDLDSDTLQVVDVAYVYDATRFNYLEHYDIQIDTIVVKNQQRTLVYEEGVDYTVEMIGRQTRIEIPRGSAITDGDQLSIDYDYTTNPDIKYGSKATSFYSSVDLFENSYRLMGQVSRGSEDLLEGDDSNVSLTDSKNYMLSIEKNIPFFTFKCGYNKMESTTDSYQSWEPSVEYNRYFNLYSLKAKLRGRQTTYDEVTYRDISSEAGTENSLLGRVSVRRRLLSIPGAIWETRADCLQLSGRGNEDMEVTVNSAVQVALGKSRIRLEGEVSWLDDDGRQSQEAFVLLQWRRFF